MPRAHLALSAVLASAGLALAGCGGDGPGAAGTTAGAGTPTGAGAPTGTAADAAAFLPDLPEPALDDDARVSRPTTVGDGLGGPPDVAPEVRRAANRAGCVVRSFASEGRDHVAPDTQVAYGTLPPTSGRHAEEWADWGVYDRPLPFPLEVHNLEHGGVIIHIGSRVPAAARSEIGRLWAESPPFVMVVPGRSTGFPPAGVVVTSWQRWLVCRPYRADMLAAVRAFRDAYRGTGPESAAALNAAGETTFPGAPRPLVADPGART
jgi:hypothetical protein